MPDPMAGFPPQPYQRLVRPMFRTLGISASGMSAQRQRLEVTATNIANAETTRTGEGGPYRRRMVELEAKQNPGEPYETVAPGVASQYRLASGDPMSAAHGVRVAAVVEDAAEGPLVYDPGHPDSDDAGYVRYPNVSITDELVNLMESRRLYEANVTAFQAAKSMLRKSLEI